MKLNKIIILVLVIGCIIDVYPSFSCKAQEQTITIDVQDIVKIEADKEQYILQSNGCVSIMQIYGIMGNGKKKELFENVQYLSEDENIITVYEGIIRAEGKGNTNIIVKYGDNQLKIPVIVENEIDLDQLEIMLLKKAGCSTMDNTQYIKIIDKINTMENTSTKTAQEILDKAAAMKNVQWTPKETLIGWDKKITFSKGVLQSGIPYSQLNQVDDIDFLSKMSSSDFYKNGTVGKDNKTCPRYGVDCSGYVSFAFGLTRMTTGDMVDILKTDKTDNDIIKVGNYDPNAMTKSDLYDAYKKLEAGNAVVYRNFTEDKGHAILVLTNNIASEQIVVYETLNTKPIVSIYSYENLWKEKYMPFKLN